MSMFGSPPVDWVRNLTVEQVQTQNRPQIIARGLMKKVLHTQCLHFVELEHVPEGAEQLEDPRSLPLNLRLDLIGSGSGDADEEDGTGYVNTSFRKYVSANQYDKVLVFWADCGVYLPFQLGSDGKRARAAPASQAALGWTDWSRETSKKVAKKAGKVAKKFKRKSVKKTVKKRAKKVSKSARKAKVAHKGKKKR